MGKIDKAKEYIGAIKVYMAFVLASIAGSVAGSIKLYLAGSEFILIAAAMIAIVVLTVVFVMLAKHLHRKIDELEFIDD